MKIEILEKNTNFKLQKSQTILYLDSDKISFPLIIRHWQKGDWFIPIGMQGKKKVSDFFTDNKFSLPDKENTWLLCSGDNILWVIGYRPDNRFKVTDNTTNVLRIELSK